MNVNSKVAGVGLALLMITSMLPPGMVGTAEAQSASSTYSVIQGSDCWEVNPYQPYDDNPVGPGGVQPHVEIVTHTEEGGSTRNSSWDGSPTIESVMDYRYRDPEGGIHGDEQAQPWGPKPHHSPWLSEFYWKEGWEFGTYGLWNWSENQESHMFFYSGPEGDSVVMRHDKLYDGVPEGSKAPYNGRNGPGDGYMSPQPDRSAVSFIFRDLPAGEWAYMDDLYPENMDSVYYASGEYDYSESQHTRFGSRHNDYGAAPLENYNGGTDFTAHWTWGPNGTDGGAYRGLHNLGPGESVTIEPYFDEESYFWSRYSWRYDRSEGDGITDWVIRRKNAENVHLDKTQSVEIRRGSHCPDASLTVGQSGSPEAGENVTLSAGEERSDATYSWDFDGDGQPDRETASASVSHAFDSSGEREVSVTVETTDGIRDSDSTSLEVVPNEDPTARLNVEPGDQGLDDYHIVGEQITLNASGSTDNSGALAEYHWEYGDGANGTNDARVAYSYSESGEYDVTVTVTDSAGNTHATTRTVEIVEPDEEAPTARGDVEPFEVEAGAPLTFDGSDSDDNRGIASYRWDFTGNGGYTAPTPNATLEAAPYGSPGNYTATLLIADGNGTVDDTTENPVVTHSYNEAGNYTATVIVEDGSGNNGTATAEIAVDENEGAISSGGGGGSVSVGPPPVDKETEQTGPNSAAIDVQNARGDETLRMDLPSAEIAGDTGVNFRSVAVDLASDNPHMVFQTAASADRPEDVTELSAAHDTLAYLELDGQYLRNGLKSATVEFTVEKSTLGLAKPDDVVVYRHDGVAWTQVNTSVVETEGDAYRLSATTDGLGTLAVATDQSLAVSEAGLESDAVATGESLTANVTVENEGETAQMGTVELALDGNVVAAETVEVPAGESVEVTLRGTAPATGTYEATVGGVSLGELDVLETRPADVSVADVSVNESTIAAGEQVAITATVENTGGEAGEQTVVLTLFGEELENETVRVDGGEKREVTFVRQIDAPGTYTAEVNGETVDVEVTESEDDGLGDAPPDVPGFGFGAALVALLAAALLARLRN